MTDNVYIEYQDSSHLVRAVFYFNEKNRDGLAEDFRIHCLETKNQENLMELISHIFANPKSQFKSPAAPSFTCYARFESIIYRKKLETVMIVDFPNFEKSFNYKGDFSKVSKTLEKVVAFICDEIWFNGDITIQSYKSDRDLKVMSFPDRGE